MKKKSSILLVLALLVFAFAPALTLAQETADDVQTTANEEELKKDYQNLEELLADLETNEDLSSVEKVTLERKLTEYDKSLSIDSISSIVDKILTEEIDIGQGFVILNNIEESVNNGFAEDKALEVINSYQKEAEKGQFAFQTALELRKLSREDTDGEKTAEFADELASIIEENGDIEISELKKLAAEYRKEAREEKREQKKMNRNHKSKTAVENDLEKGKDNNAADKALDKTDKSKDKSDLKEKSNSGNSDKDKSSNSKADQNSQK